MLLVVPYNSVYYNYITIIQWLVGWFGDQGKKGVCIGKKSGEGAGRDRRILKVVIFPSQKYTYLKHSEICFNRWACFQKKRHNFC